MCYMCNSGWLRASATSDCRLGGGPWDKATSVLRHGYGKEKNRREAVREWVSHRVCPTWQVWEGCSPQPICVYRGLLADQPALFTASSSLTPALTDISTFLPCLSYFGKKTRNNLVLFYKTVRPSGRAAVRVSLAGYLIQPKRWVKGRAGIALVWHTEDALSHKAGICMSLVHLRGSGQV